MQSKLSIERRDGMVDALLHRLNPSVAISDAGRSYRGMTLLEIGREFFEAAGVSVRGMSRMELSGLMTRSGSHSTSDFPSLLANVANKRLRQAYDESNASYKVWARRAPNAADFKTISAVQLGAMPDLLRTNEHGEFQYGAVSDGKETYSLLTYGRIVSLTRQAIVNDDLRGFDRLISGFGSSAARLENRTVYAQLTGNAALSDGVALFHATHGNLQSGAGSALSLTSLATARGAMRVQKGLQSEELNIAPAWLLAPAALEQTAYQYTSANYVPATPGAVNEFRAGGRASLVPVIEPLLDAASATAWYVAAATNQIDTVEYCYLEGAEGPQIETDAGFEVDGMAFKCRLDFATKAIDFRGLQKNVGA